MQVKWVHYNQAINHPTVLICTLKGTISFESEISTCFRPNKEIPVFRETRPYLNLLVKPRIFFRFSGKNIILCILKGEMPLKMHKIMSFQGKKCVPILPKIFRPITQYTLRENL